MAQYERRKTAHLRGLASDYDAMPLARSWYTRVKDKPPLGNTMNQKARCDRSGLGITLANAQADSGADLWGVLSPSRPGGGGAVLVARVEDESDDGAWG
eukprot:1657977-Rhodomonas_salina.3